MDTENGQNGAGGGKVYVSFGPRDTEEMPLKWAEDMLTMLKADHPAQFGKMMGKVSLAQ